ncbi:MAG: ABC transporter permease subunit [Solirubrobacterales bacterium]|nr:ABC transporter permease subunit [Solirubrobacterales bacterium]
MSRRRIGAIFRKELREYRRNRSLVVGMAIIPLVFLAQPLVSVFALPASASAQLAHRHELLYLLAIPALAPGLMAAYSVVGERQQGTLEPVLTTPIRREELLLGKALAVFLLSLAVSYAVYALFLACTALFASPGVAPALIRVPDIVAQVIFTPLIAGWSIWLAIGISTRASEVRVAQQLSMLASLPSVAVTSLIAFDVIPASLRLAAALGVVLLILDRVGWRLTSAMFDRERLIVGTK